MAQKSLKTLAAKNAASLNRIHLISLGTNGLFLLIRSLLFTRRLLPYLLLTFPALAIEFWFERIARPTYTEGTNGAELKRAGEDLEAKGLTEWMWDILYWTWGCIGVVALFGDWAWWLWAVVPLYSAYLAFTTYRGMRSGLGGMMGGEGKVNGAQSKRQAKMEKRGGPKVQYR